VIDDMTVFDVDELCSYWSRHPPIHVLVAAFLGVDSEKPTREVRSPQPSQAQPPPVLANIPGLTPMAHTNVPTPIFDVAELMALRPDR
jgi:hypothetical protein